MTYKFYYAITNIIYVITYNGGYMDISKKFSTILYEYMKIIIQLKVLEGFCIANRCNEEVGYILYFVKKINRMIK